MRMLFDQVGRHWAPKLRSKRCLEAPAEVPDESAVVAAEGDDPPTPPDQVEDDEIDGTITPPPRTMNDEYLAWTLGGSLRKTASLGSPWTQGGSPEEVAELSDGEIDKKLQMIENLICTKFCICFLQKNPQNKMLLMYCFGLWTSQIFTTS